MSSLFCQQNARSFHKCPREHLSFRGQHGSTVLSMNTDSTKIIVNFSDRLCGVELVLDLIIINSAGCLFQGAVPTLSLSANLPSIFLSRPIFYTVYLFRTLGQ